jgi:hypothetical protein
MVAAPGHQQLWPGPVLISPAPSLLLESPNRQSPGVASAAQPALTGIALASSLLLDSPNRQSPGVSAAAQHAEQATAPGVMQLPVRPSPWLALANDTALPASTILTGNATERPAPPADSAGDTPSVAHGWGGWPAEDGKLATAIGSVALDAAFNEIQPPAATGGTVSGARQATDADDMSKGFTGSGYPIEISSSTKLASREAQPAFELRADWPTWTAGGGLLVVWLRKVLGARTSVRRFRQGGLRP